MLPIINQIGETIITRLELIKAKYALGIAQINAKINEEPEENTRKIGFYSDAPEEEDEENDM